MSIDFVNFFYAYKGPFALWALVVLEVISRGHSQGFFEHGAKGALGGITQVLGNMGDGAVAGNAAEGLKEPCLLPPLAEGHVGLRFEVAGQCPGGGTQAGGPGFQGGFVTGMVLKIGSDLLDRAVIRHRQVQGGGRGCFQKIQYQPAKTPFHAVRIIKGRKSDGLGDQLPHQGGDGHDLAAGRQSGNNSGSEIDVPEGDGVDNFQGVHRTGGNPDGTLGRRNPDGAFGHDLHNAAGGIEELTQLMGMGGGFHAFPAHALFEGHVPWDIFQPSDFRTGIGGEGFKRGYQCRICVIFCHICVYTTF